MLDDAIAATVGNRTDLAKRLREVYGLHAFAELFGFDWSDESDWDWHDVACAMADAVDAATACAVPETKYLMALDEAREAQRKLEMCQTIQRAYQSKCRSLKETNADLRRIIDDMKAATVGAGTCIYTPDEAGFTWWDENDVEHYEEYSASDECGSASCDKCGYQMMVGDDGWFNGWDEIIEWTEEDGSEHKGYVLKPRFKHCPECGARVVSE